VFWVRELEEDDGPLTRGGGAGFGICGEVGDDDLGLWRAGEAL